MPSPARPLLLTAMLGVGACAEAEAEADADATLTQGLADAPEPRGELVYEEQLRWVHFDQGTDSQQIASVYRDGSQLLMLRRGLDGRVHGWTEGPLSPAAREALDIDNAAADPSLGAALDPCPWSDSNHAALLLGGQRFEFMTRCAGPGLDALAGRYAGLTNELLACPFPPWVEEFDRDPTFVPSFADLACEADESSESWETPS